MEATFSSSSSAALSAIASAFRTPEDLLLCPPYDLAEALDLSLKEAEEARAALAARFLFGSAEGAEDLGLLPPTLLSLSASYPPRHIPTGLPALDAALGGGIRMGIVTEIVGPAGAGKTQLCLCLAAAALGQWPRRLRRRQPRRCQHRCQRRPRRHRPRAHPAAAPCTNHPAPS